jgi:hypothetical protein
LKYFKNHKNTKTTAYFMLRNGSGLARSVAGWQKHGGSARHSANPGRQSGTSRSSQAAHIGSGGSSHRGSSTINFQPKLENKYYSQQMLESKIRK